MAAAETVDDVVQDLQETLIHDSSLSIHIAAIQYSMTMADSGDSNRTCACGCGEPVTGTWKRGHAIRGRAGNLRSLPSPDLPDEELDQMIEMPDEEIAEALAAVQRGETVEREDYSRYAGRSPRGPQRPVEPPSREPEGEDLGDDSEPAHIGVPRRDRERAARPSQTGARIRVTATVRKDVEAKIRFVAVPAGRMWASSDPVCGGTFCQQEPEISGALAEIVCDSPDLLAWFTGPQGKYMKFFNLFMACLPVGMAVYGHHLHRQGEQEGQDPNQPPIDYQQYAA